jgi:FtsZ-binding cell division protein ZapB
MSGYWIVLGWLLASIGSFGLLIANMRKRIDTITYAVGLSGLAAAMLVLAVGQVWKTYQSDAAQAQISNELHDIGSEGARIKSRVRTLQERIDANKADMEAISQPRNLTPTTDPDAIRSRAERVAAYQKEASALQEESNAVSRDSQALKERTDATQSELNDSTRARAFRDLLTSICALAIGTLAVVGGLFISRAQRKKIAEPIATVSANRSDPPL